MRLGRMSVGLGAAGWRRVALCAAVTGLVAVLVGTWLGGLFTQSDSTHYLNLAAGKPAMLPFASRQLAPLIVRGLASLGMSVEHGFVALGLVSLGLFVATVAWLLGRIGAPGWTIWGVMGLGFWAQQFNGLVLPDLFYGALVCCFLLLLWRGWVLAACLMFLPLYLAREATLLLLVCFLAACWKQLRWRERDAAFLSAAAGFLIVRQLSANALPNQEHIPPAFYLLAKMPWNFVKNFLGLSPWANVYPACPIPAAHFALHLGRLTDIGYCGFEARLPVRLAGAALASFGLLPLLLWRVRKARLVAQNPRLLMLRFCVAYGVVSFLMAGLLGDSVQRLFGYGWPVFLVAVPLLVVAGRFDFRADWAAWAFVAVHLGLSWAGLWVRGWPLLMCGLAAYAAGWWLVRSGARTAPGLREAR